MGNNILYQYSLLHFASGVIAYFWGVPFGLWFIFHALFEIFENTETGMNIINNYLLIWPGGKPYSDSIVNRFSDQFFASLGWLVAYYFDKLNI